MKIAFRDFQVLFALFFIMLASVLLSPSLWAQASSLSPLVNVVHVDIIPQYTDQAILLLRTYRRDSLSDRGCKRIDVLQQVGRPNHFTLIEEWANQRFYDKHVSAVYTIRFRTKIAPMLGSPFDERMHRFMNLDSK